MASSNYARGRAFEYRTRDKLKKHGAAYVMRAAQSKGEVDLLALWPTMAWLQDFASGEIRLSQPGDNIHVPQRPWLVQCKYSIHGGGYLPKKDALVLSELATQTGSVPVLARPGKNGRGVEFINVTTKEKLLG